MQRSQHLIADSGVELGTAQVAVDGNLARGLASNSTDAANRMSRLAWQRQQAIKQTGDHPSYLAVHPKPLVPFRNAFVLRGFSSPPVTHLSYIEGFRLARRSPPFQAVIIITAKVGRVSYD